MSKAKKVKAGKLYTNGRAQVVFVAAAGPTICNVFPVQRSNISENGEVCLVSDIIKYWPYVVDRIVIEQEDFDPGMKLERKR